MKEIKVDLNKYEVLIDTLDDELECIVISTPFDSEELCNPFKFKEEYKLYIDYINNVISRAILKLKKGGLLFVYGLPRWLPHFAQYLNNTQTMDFKYWIALEIANEDNQKGLNKKHVGLLMYVNGKNVPFSINTDLVRIPYNACSACGKNIKDWGGKKHLINKSGACISDVWKDFHEVISETPDPQVEGLMLQNIDIDINTIENYTSIPPKVLNRIVKLTNNTDRVIHIICDSLLNFNSLAINNDNIMEVIRSDLKSDIYLGDCIEIMNDLAEKYPQGCFDLIFADPPYNLDKLYSNYDDKEADDNYINWCNDWLELCSKLLKPGGNLFVLNLPKWAIYHSLFLNDKLYFQDWIVWDAMSTPKGKIMPAHYALLHYSKSFSYYIDNDSNNFKIDAPNYCLRQSCINKRKKLHDDKKSQLSDIWSDVSRIKHKRDRDDHPCQLPDKLLERIISLYSKDGEYVFDPFSGAGTTPVIAKKLGREYVAIDISEEYVNLGKNKIEQINLLGDVIKKTVTKSNRKVTKKSIEIYIQDLCVSLGYRPEEEEFVGILNNDSNATFSVDDIINLYGEIKLALKSGRIALKQRDK